MKQSKIKSKKAGKWKNGVGDMITERVLDMKDFTFCQHGVENGLIYLSHFFDKRFLIGFWTHSPWGIGYDREQGWAIIDRETMRVVEECASRVEGMGTGETREWRTRMKEKYGVAHKLLNYCEEQEWKITEC